MHHGSLWFIAGLVRRLFASMPSMYLTLWTSLRFIIHSIIAISHRHHLHHDGYLCLLKYTGVGMEKLQFSVADSNLPHIPHPVRT